MLFLTSVLFTISTLIINGVVYGMARADSKVNSTIVIIVCSVVVGIIGLPLLGFFIFHIYLSCTGKTTREVIKNIKGEKQDIQWCEVDAPLINYF